MKSISFLFVSLFIWSVGIAQKDTTEVLKAVKALQYALVEKDADVLNKLLHTDIAYGHSNGWVQTKNDVLKDMKSGYMVYQKIDSQSTAITINKNYATVKERIAVEGTRDGNAFKLNLFVLHLWVKTKSGWQLLSRQSTKL